MQDNRTRSIIIAEDESIIAMDIKNILSMAGYNILSIVRNKKELIKEVSSKKPDLIVMEIKMKGKTDETQGPYEIKNSFDMPVLFISDSYSNEKPIIDATEPVNHNVIAKPYEEKKLLNMVENLLNTEARAC